MVLTPYHFFMGILLSQFPTTEFLELISSGMTEPRALAHLDIPRPTYTQMLLKDPSFKESVEQAKRDRADVHYEKIVDSVDEKIPKQDVPAAKLRFEKLKYLAAVDNPDKYAEKTKHSLDVNVNIFQEMKELPAAEARKILESVNPFAVVDAEFKPVAEEENLEDAL